jgi:hypothetical protein
MLAYGAIASAHFGNCIFISESSDLSSGRSSPVCSTRYMVSFSGFKHVLLWSLLCAAYALIL